MRRIYFDHLSATPVLSEAWEAMTPFFRDCFGNPSSAHQEGLRARRAIQEARAQVAALLHAGSPDEILFTSGGTEALNLAVKGVARASQRHGRHLVVSSIEHLAVLKSAESLVQQGFTCTLVPVDGKGLVSPDAVEAAMTPETVLVAVQHANHEIGTIQPVAEVGRITAERGVPFLVDATASGGWLPIDVQAMGADLLVLSPHRFHGPKGVGVLYRNRRARLVALQHGGGQEGGYRAGTENVPGIVGAGVAAEVAGRELAERQTRLAEVQRRVWEGVKQRVSYVKLNGPEPGPLRIPTSLNFSTEFIEGEGQVMACDLHGIAVASGSSCVGGSLRIPHVLSAIGLPPELALSVVIVSFGRDNELAEADYFVEIFAERVVNRLRAMSPKWDGFQRGLIDSRVEPRGLGARAGPAMGARDEGTRDG